MTLESAEAAQAFLTLRRLDPKSTGRPDPLPGPRHPPQDLPRCWTGTCATCGRDVLRGRVREESGRDTEPTAGVIDSQSAKADAVVGPDSRGFDGGKLVTAASGTSWSTLLACCWA
ncbi:hypothetical protein [Streptomyces sp. 372A]